MFKIAESPFVYFSDHWVQNTHCTPDVSIILQILYRQHAGMSQKYGKIIEKNERMEDQTRDRQRNLCFRIDVRTARTSWPFRTIHSKTRGFPRQLTHTIMEWVDFRMFQGNWSWANKYLMAWIKHEPVLRLYILSDVVYDDFSVLIIHFYKSELSNKTPKKNSSEDFRKSIFS